MTDSITRCPHCETTFRVTEAQLRVASGMVRCGTCLRVFSAVEEMLGQAIEPADEAFPEFTPPPDPDDDQSGPEVDDTPLATALPSPTNGTDAAYEEPSADEEPSAHKEPSADKEPSAHKEPPNGPADPHGEDQPALSGDVDEGDNYFVSPASPALPTSPELDELDDVDFFTGDLFEELAPAALEDDPVWSALALEDLLWDESAVTESEVLHAREADPAGQGVDPVAPGVTGPSGLPEPRLAVAHGQD